MPERIRRMTAREVETLLRRYGYQLISQKGSHRKWRSQVQNVQVIVPEHRGRQLPIGTLRTILKDSKIPDREWRS